MASHFSFHDGVSQVIPYSRKYVYPTQSNRAWKSVIKIPPKNGATFINTQSSTPIRFELPAQGYLCTKNTFLQFDVAITSGDGKNLRFANGIQSIFKRVRILYGSLVIEDLREYHVLMRILTEATGTNTVWVSDQTAIAEGIGGIRLYPCAGLSYNTSTNPTPYLVMPENVRVAEIQSNTTINSFTSTRLGTIDVTQGSIVDGTRRYSIQLGAGLFQQNKLIPLKWMAAQLAIELELCTNTAECMMGSTTAVPSTTTFTLSNMALLCELLEFDGGYDQGFLNDGLRSANGVPIKFSSWNTFQFTPSASTQQNLQIPERNRSLKAVFLVQIPNPLTASSSYYPWDSHAFLESSTSLSAATGLATGHLQNYQLRAGGKMYPAQPVTSNIGSYTNGGAEVYLELAKALNIVGDYRMSTGISPSRWNRPLAAKTGESCCIDWMGTRDVAEVTTLTNYMRGPSCHIIGIDLETSDGSEISGLNGEEQNDLSLILNYSSAQSTSCQYNVYVFCDELLVLRENNLVELIK